MFRSSFGSNFDGFDRWRWVTSPVWQCCLQHLLSTMCSEYCCCITLPRHDHFSSSLILASSSLASQIHLVETYFPVTYNPVSVWEPVYYTVILKLDYRLHWGVVLVCWWWRFDWSFARLIAPVVSNSLCSFKCRTKTLETDRWNNETVSILPSRVRA